MGIGLFITSVILFLIYYFEGEFFIVSIVVCRLFSRAVNPILWTYASEIYRTRSRTTGIGFVAIWAQIGGILIPLFSVYMFGADPFLPYLIMGLLALIAAVTSFLLPYELLGKGLDLKDDDIYQEENT
jgi:MFS family permease